MTEQTNPNPPQPSEVVKKVALLIKAKRNSGSMLSNQNLESLTQGWVLMVNQNVLAQFKPFLNDKSQETQIMKEFDFELFKALRNWVQATYHIGKMIDVRVEEINKLIVDNQELFDKLQAEAKAEEEAAAAKEQRMKEMEQYAFGKEDAKLDSLSQTGAELVITKEQPE